MLRIISYFPKNMFAVNWLAVTSLPIGIFSGYLNTEVSWVARSPPDPAWQPSTMYCRMSVDIFLTVKEKITRFTQSS